MTVSMGGAYFFFLAPPETNGKTAAYAVHPVVGHIQTAITITSVFVSMEKLIPSTFDFLLWLGHRGAIS